MEGRMDTVTEELSKHPLAVGMLYTINNIDVGSGLINELTRGNRKATEPIKIAMRSRYVTTYCSVSLFYAKYSSPEQRMQTVASLLRVCLHAMFSLESIDIAVQTRHSCFAS